MDVTYRFFVGIDWASEEHEICAVTDSAEQVVSFRVANSVIGLHEMTKRLRDLSDAGLDKIAVAIETL